MLQANLQKNWFVKNLLIAAIAVLALVFASNFLLLQTKLHQILIINAMPFAQLICVAVCVSAILTLRLSLKEDATFIIFSTHSSSLSARNNVAY